LHEQSPAIKTQRHNEKPAELDRISGPETLRTCFALSAHPRRHDHLLVMMVMAMMEERSHLTLIVKSDSAASQPEKHTPSRRGTTAKNLADFSKDP
jgi:hypothetical protein